MTEPDTEFPPGISSEVLIDLAGNSDRALAFLAAKELGRREERRQTMIYARNVLRDTHQRRMTLQAAKCREDEVTRFVAALSLAIDTRKYS